MGNRTVFLLLLAIGSGVGLAVPVLSQQTDQIQTLDLNLENFPDQLSQNKELSLDREKFPEHVKELELNLEQFPDQAPDQRGKRKNERLNLD